MTHKKREEAAGLLLHARGAVSCFIPFGMEKDLNENCILNGVRAGNIQNTMEKSTKYSNFSDIRVVVHAKKS